MALTKIVKFNDKLSWALWKIDASWQVLLSQARLSATEEVVLSSISHAQKKAEFLASRLALDALLIANNTPEYEIYKDLHGKPFIKEASFHISLANSFPYAVAALHQDKAVGIDIEPPSDKLVRIQHKFLHQHEYAFFADQPERLCLAWCAKESLYKLHGRRNLSFKQDIIINKILYPHQPLLFANILLDSSPFPYQLQIERIENYFILFSV